MGTFLRCLSLALVLVVWGAAPSLHAAPRDPPYKLPARAELNKIRSAIISTQRGDIYMELFPEDAPWSVANFKYLADKGFYDGSVFHLSYPGFIIQGGGPKGTPDGGAGYVLPAEFSTRHHEPGTLGMARLPDDANPTRASHSSQFHIVLAPSPHMDGNYTIFGRVIKGLEVAESLRKGDRIREIRVFIRP